MDSSEHLSDDGLLALVARGDRHAFAALYHRTSTRAFSLALRIVRDRELAADAVQDAYLSVWDRAGSFDGHRGQPSAWILTLVHHKAVDMVRRSARLRAVQFDDTELVRVDSEPDLDEQAHSSITGRAARRALRDLPHVHREVLELAYFAGYQQSEVAERLAIPLGTVKSRTFAALDALRLALAEAVPSEAGPRGIALRSPQSAADPGKADRVVHAREGWPESR